MHLTDRREVTGVLSGGIRKQEHELGAAAAPQLHPVAMGETVRLDFLTVDERAMPGAKVANLETVAGAGDLGMVARHFPAWQVQVTRRPPADDKRVLCDLHQPVTELVCDFKSGLVHLGRWVPKRFVWD